MAICSVCNCTMSSDRAEFYSTCISCTPQGKNVGLTTGCNKTGFHVGTIIRFNDSESIRLASQPSNCVIRRKHLDLTAIQGA